MFFFEFTRQIWHFPAVVKIGELNTLKVLKHVDHGVYLDGGDDGEILLPLRFMPEQCEVGDLLEVFIHFDSEDRLIATTDRPFAMVGEFAHLKIKAIERVGAFLDWGLPKDLFLPFAEQTRDLRVGQYVVVFLYVDKSDRISASMRLDRNISKEPATYKEGDRVDLFVAAQTELGFKAVINGRHWGVLYANEVFTKLDFGQRLPGFIKRIRPDGKIDLRLHQEAQKDVDDIGEKIMKALKDRGGFLPINDKTPAEMIYDLFGVSKKKYKMALGALYKKRMILVTEQGIKDGSKAED